MLIVRLLNNTRDGFFLVNFFIFKHFMLQIEIDAASGFCFGVTTAIEKAEEELALGQSLYCLGDIVHNGSECERLHALGMKTIDHADFEHLRDAKVLLRAHGEPPRTCCAKQY